MYVWNKSLPDPKVLASPTPENTQVVHLYLAASQSDIALWRTSIMEADKPNVQISHVVLYGDKATTIKTYFCMMEPVQAYILLNNQLAKPFAKVIPRENFIPLYH